MVPISHYILLSLMMFSVGVFGVIVRRNAIVVFMCIELMLNAANLAFVAFSRHHNDISAQVLVFFIMTVAAAEAAVGLAVILALFRTAKSVESRDAGELKE